MIHNRHKRPVADILTKVPLIAMTIAFLSLSTIIEYGVDAMPLTKLL